VAEALENPFAEILDEAERQIRVLAETLFQEYSAPLYSNGKTGVAAFEWPEDPEAMSPEEMAQLVQTHGDAAVEAWLTEHYITKAQQSQLDEGETP
jgi:hypothetical protein